MTSFNQNVIRHKVGLLNLAAELGNVSRACKVMGLSRDTFYRYQTAMADGGVEALLDSNRRKPNPKNRVEEATEMAVVAYATEQPAHGQTRASNELRKQGIFVSPSGVRSIWLRNDLASFKQRLSALEKQVAEHGGIVIDCERIIRPCLHMACQCSIDCEQTLVVARVLFPSIIRCRTPGVRQSKASRTKTPLILSFETLCRPA